MIANSGHDENGRYWGGQPGDQTGGEWCVRAWYSCPWDVVLRHPNQAFAADAAELGRHAAANDLIGYNQLNRESFWNRLSETGTYDPADIATACDDDCSAGVTAIWKAVGYRHGDSALQALGPDTYTGNLRERFEAAGFEPLWGGEYTGGASRLMPGDVLLNEGFHTALNLDLGDEAGAWNPGESEEDEMNQGQCEQLGSVYYWANYTEDPTGRGCTGSTPAERIVWLGKKTDDILADLETVKANQDAISKALADLAEAVGKLKASKA